MAPSVGVAVRLHTRKRSRGTPTFPPAVKLQVSAMRYRIPFLLLCVSALPLLAEPARKSEALDASMQRFVDAGDLAGVVTFVGTKDGVIDVQVVGLADLENKAPMKRDTIFRIASMTK